MADSPETSWHCVFLFGLVPAGVAFLVRLCLQEPERWKEAVKNAAAADGLDTPATLALVEEWKFRATCWFNMGGLVGTLLAILVTKILGRRALFGIHFAASAAAIFATFGIDWEPTVRLYWNFAIGIIAAQGTHTVLQTLFYVGLVPAPGLFLLPWVIETRDKVLAD